MEKKWIIIPIIVILIVSIILIIYFIKNNSFNQSPTNLEECKTISYNGENKINIVFFSSKENAEKYSNYFLTLNPFSENKDAFNFYYIDNYIPECETYKGIAILCYNEELIKKASSCPNDYIVIIKDSDFNMRSSSYMNVMSINSNHPLSVFPHEFGHAFMTLAEEYTPATIPRGAKNCQKSCEKFSINDGCYQGCSQDSYMRSIDNGIMRTLNSQDYGKFNAQLILDKIKKNSITTGNAIASETQCRDQKNYLIKGNYSQGQISILGKSIEPGCPGTTDNNGEIQYKLTTEDNTILATENFNPELIFTDAQSSDQQQIQGQPFERDGTFFLKLQIIPQAKNLEILKENEQLTQINLEDMKYRPCQIK